MLITILSFTSVTCLCVVCHFLCLRLLHFIKVNDILTDNLIDIFLHSDITLPLFMLLKRMQVGKSVLYTLQIYASQKKKIHVTATTDSKRISFSYCLSYEESQ